MVEAGISAAGLFTKVKDRQLSPFTLTDSNGKTISGVVPYNSRALLGSGGIELSLRHSFYPSSNRIAIIPEGTFGMAWAHEYSTIFWSVTADTAINFLKGDARLIGKLGYGGHGIEVGNTASEKRHGLKIGGELAVRIARNFDLAVNGGTTITPDGLQTVMGLSLYWFFNRQTEPAVKMQSPVTPELQAKQMILASTSRQDAVPKSPKEGDSTAEQKARILYDAMEARRALLDAEQLLKEAELPTTPWFGEFLAEVSKYGWNYRSNYAEQRAISDCLAWLTGPKEWKTVRLRPLHLILKDLDIAIRTVELKGDDDLRGRISALRKRGDRIAIATAHNIATHFRGESGIIRWRAFAILLRKHIDAYHGDDLVRRDILERSIQDFDDILVHVTRNLSLLIPQLPLEEREDLHRVAAAIHCLRFAGPTCRKEDIRISVPALNKALAKSQETIPPKKQRTRKQPFSSSTKGP